MIRAIKLHLLGIKIAFACRMAYRADFIISSLITLAGDMIVPMVTFLVYRTGSSFPGWNLYEVLLIQGIFMISRGIAFTFFYGTVWNTLSAVREGTFDILLLRPHSALHMTMVTGINLNDLGVFLGGVVLTGAALWNLPAPGLLHIIGFTGFFILSVIILISFAVLMSATVFKWVGNSRVYEIFDSISNFGQYPATIFSKTFNTLLTWIIPVSMLGFIPASVLLGKPVEGILATIPIALAFFVFSLILWNRMQRLYTSSGG